MSTLTPEEEGGDFGQTMRGVVGGTQLFHRFTLQKVLGRGGMGVVWLAHDDRLERLVALKLVPEAVCFDPSAREDLKRETRKSLLLTHPNIVRIFDFIEDQQTAAICMEYVDGSTLSYARVQKRLKCFETTDLVPWLTSLCDALAYAHESVSLVHRDLKPANMMVNSRSELKITDFGIACSLRDSISRVSVHTSSGTMNYMSPQQMLGEDPSPSDDIYALGASLYEMLSSKPPFYTGDVASQLREVIPPTISQRRLKLGIAGEKIPKHWEETIAACLSKHRDQRPRSASEVARRLRLGGTIRLSTVKEAAEPVYERYRKFLPLMGAAVGLLAGGVYYLSNSFAPQAATLPALKKRRSVVGYAFESPVEIASNAKTNESPGLSTSTSIAGPQNPAIQLVTTPANATFAIYSGVVAGKTPPSTAPLLIGVTPKTVVDLPPGRYTIFFHKQGWPNDHVEIAVESDETVPVEYTFPHSSVTISSNPNGAEIFAGDTSLGHTPMTVDLPLGRQELIARYSDFPKKTEIVTIEAETPATVAFQLHQRSHSTSAKSKAPESAWDKLGNSLKKAFTGKSQPKKKKNR